MPMRKIELCVYRESVNDERSESNVQLPFLNPTQPVFECQILKKLGVPDTTCYNHDLNENNCSISPQAEKPSTI